MSTYIIFENDLRENEDVEKERGLKIDVVYSMTRTNSQDSTDFAIEDGSTISDGTVKNPQVINIEGFMGNGTQLDAPNDQGINPIAQGAHTEFYNRCVEAVETGELVHIVSENRGTYIDYLITSITTQSSVETGFGIPFSLSLKRVRKAFSKTTQTRVTTPGTAIGLAAGRTFNDGGDTGKISISAATTEQAAQIREIAGVA